MASIGACVCIGLVSVLALGVVGVRSQSQCARECLTAGFGTEFDVIGEASSLSIQSSIGQASQLESFCSKKDTVTACLASCKSAPDKFTYDIMTGMMAYVCGPGKKALLSESGCWQMAEYQELSHSCSLDMQTKLQDRIARVRMGKASMDLVCGTLDEFKSCMVTNVDALCGGVAAGFVENLFQAVIQPTRFFLKCPGGPRAKRNFLEDFMQRHSTGNQMSGLP